MEEDLKLKFIEDLGMQDVSKSEKKNVRRVWLVECPYCNKHFKIRATQMKEYKSCGCRIPNKETKESLSIKLNKKFTEHKLDLDNFLFIEGQHSPLSIICKEHGSFETTANNMLNARHSPCPKCSSIISNKNISGDVQGFIDNAIKKYGDRFAYDKLNFKTLSEDVLIYCNIHKDYFKINANNFLYSAKIGCPKCIEDKKLKVIKHREANFIKVCKDIHGDNYDLSKINYSGINKNIEVICHKHGSWFPIAYNFEKGSGCPVCAELQKERRYLDKPTLFYIFKVRDLYKVGITTKTLEGRYIGKELNKEEFENIELIFEYTFNTGRPAFRLEQKLRHLFRGSLYKGESPFKVTGISEIFTECPDINIVREEIEALNETK